jgi:hypothetical protein
MSLTKLSDFMQVSYKTRKQYTKNEDFPMHIIFTRMYLLQEQELYHRNYSKQKINMSNFVEASEHVFAHVCKVWRFFLFV